MLVRQRDSYNFRSFLRPKFSLRRKTDERLSMAYMFSRLNWYKPSSGWVKALVDSSWVTEIRVLFVGLVGWFSSTFKAM